MKTTMMIVVAAVVVASVLVLTGCPTEKEETMSKTERLDAFVSDINNDDTGITDNLSDNAANKATANLTFWQTYFGEENSLAYSGASTTGDTVTATFSNTDIVNTSYSFTMEEEKSDYYVILKVTQGSTVIFE